MNKRFWIYHLLNITSDNVIYEIDTDDALHMK